MEGGALFLDLSGFTELTGALMELGDSGAEHLSDIINTLFEPLLAEVKRADGFVATFAGDAFTAVFPNRSPDSVAQLGRSLQRVLARNHMQRTPAGEFGIEAKVGVGTGEVQWGIVEGSERSAYFFRGAAIDEAAAAEGHAGPGEVVLGPSAAEKAAESLTLKEVAAGFSKLDSPGGEGGAESFAVDQNESEEEYPTGEDLERLTERYVPLEELPRRAAGEFRWITSVFVSFEAGEGYDAIAEAVTPIVDLSVEYGGYLNLLDFGEKGAVALILFGAPSAHGDDIKRAANFSGALVEQLGEAARAGLAAGTAFTGYVGSSERATYTALGSVVNLSARLAMDAGPGTVVTAGEAVDELESRRTLTEIYSRQFKGFSKELAVYSIGHSEDSRAVETPFVGRETRIRRLTEVAERMLSERECSHYLLGEAGVGKSRIMRHLVAELGEAANSIILETDTILRKSMNSLPRLIRRAFELAGLDVDALEGPTAISRLTAWLEDHEVEAETVEELRRTGSGLLALLGPVAQDSLYAQLDPEARFELTAGAFLALATALSRVQPLLIVADNAHALDADTQTIYARLVSGVVGDRFGVFFVGRGTGGRSPFGIESEVTQEQVTVLEGFSPEEVGKVAANVIQGPVADSLVDFIIHRVGTNPLYVTELTRYLAQNRYLRRGADGYEVSTSEVSLPTEVNALLVARIDSLPRKVKETAQAAAVLGAEFDPIVLEKLVNADEDFDSVLEQGEVAGLWLDNGDGTYRFKQELVRTAMEEMQLSSTMRGLHARAAHLLEQLYPNDPSMNADLAYHFIRADMPERAKATLRAAADYAIENFKNEKALEFLESYQEYAKNFAERITAYRDMASIYELTGRWEKAIDTLTYAVGLSVIVGDLAARARLLTSLGEIYRKQSANKTAIAILDQARKIARDRKEYSTYAEALIYLGRSHWALGDYSTALSHFDEALSTSTEQDDLKLEALALYYQGTVLRDQNKYDKADRNFERSYQLFRQLGDDRLSTYPLYDLGVVRLYQGQIDEAKNYFERALNTYKQIGYLSGASAATLNLGVLRDRRGDFRGAIRYYQEARRIAESINEQLAIGYTLFSIGATQYKVGDNRKALAYLRDAFDILKRLDAKGYFGYVLSYLVSLMARTGNTDRAVRLAYQHHKVTTSVGSDPENGRAIMGLATALEKRPKLGKTSKELLKRIARAHGLDQISPVTLYRRAIELSEPMKYVDTLIPAHFHLAEHLAANGDEESFRHHLRTAFELAVEAKWDRFIMITRKNHGQVLEEMGVDTDVETEEIEGVGE
jgi:class 3 adenylate cyclase/tetratricopeptide (TPR) repeat protein